MWHTSTISTVLIYLLNSEINQAEDSFQVEVLLACSVASISSPSLLPPVTAAHRGHILFIPAVIIMTFLWRDKWPFWPENPPWLPHNSYVRGMTTATLCTATLESDAWRPTPNRMWVPDVSTRWSIFVKTGSGCSLQGLCLGRDRVVGAAC